MFGDHTIQVGDRKQWKAGPIDILVCRQRGELRIGRRQMRDALSQDITEQTIIEGDGAEPEFSTTRFSTVEQVVNTISISPRPAPMPLVVSLREPVVLRPNSITSVFVSPPIWVTFSTKQFAKPFHEVPALDLKQTWFGPNHREGELCLSCTNRGTIHADFVTHHALRALTRLEVHQPSGTPFHLEKLKLPMPALNLYRDDKDNLHTDGLRMTIENDRVQLSITKELRISSSNSVQLVSKSRSRGTTGLERAFSAMLG